MAHHEGRGAEVKNHLRPSQEALGADRPLRIPALLADANTEGDAVQREDAGFLARLEVARLVKRTRPGENALVVYPGEMAIMEDGGSVEKALLEVDEADDGRQARGRRSHALERAPVFLEKAGSQQQVVGRAPSDRELWKGNHVHPAGAGLLQGRQDRLDVPVQIAHPGVHLIQADSQRLHLVGPLGGH